MMPLVPVEACAAVAVAAACYVEVRLRWGQWQRRRKHGGDPER